MGKVFYLKNFSKKWGDIMPKDRKGTISVKDVANYFLSKIDVQTGSVMTHLKLQKLCYYAQAWSLVFEGTPLFKENFQAWAHGPVCPSLWREFKDYSYHEIPPVVNFNQGIFNADQLDTLDAVWDAYGQFDGRYLEELTHQEAPWIKARNGLGRGFHCTKVIDQEDMKQYYSQLFEEKNGEE